MADTGGSRAFASFNMVIPPEMKRAVRRLVEVFGKFAAEQGWGPSEYRLLFDLNPDWGKIHVALVAHQFPGKDWKEQWLNVMNFVKKELGEDKVLIGAVDLIIRTFKRVEEDGDAALGPQFLEIGDLW